MTGFRLLAPFQWMIYFKGKHFNESDISSVYPREHSMIQASPVPYRGSRREMVKPLSPRMTVFVKGAGIMTGFLQPNPRPNVSHLMPLLPFSLLPVRKVTEPVLEFLPCTRQVFSSLYLLVITVPVK